MKIPNFNVREVGSPNAKRYVVVNRAGDFYGGGEKWLPDNQNREGWGGEKAWVPEDLDRDAPKGATLYHRQMDAALVVQMFEEDYHKKHKPCHHLQATVEVNVYGEHANLAKVAEYLCENLEMTLDQSVQTGPTKDDFITVRVDWNTLEILDCSTPIDDFPELDLD